MSIEVTARHMNAPGAKDHAQQQCEKLVELFPRIEHIHMILNIEKHRHEAEVVVQAKNHIRVEAHETEDDMIAAIDGAVGRAERQLRKLRDKVQDHRGRRTDDRVDEVDTVV
ncbi:MAG: ribosome-associated translation inhibitor RaiA [Verrucomicrobia bacterium]|jgi:putative sigma-54 modulation protein|nr:ribosome-associated translation inhibitor RaiA [Verrucomicrobiota bacterium]